MVILAHVTVRGILGELLAAAKNTRGVVQPAVTVVGECKLAQTVDRRQFRTCQPD